MKRFLKFVFIIILGSSFLISSCTNSANVSNNNLLKINKNSIKEVNILRISKHKNYKDEDSINKIVNHLNSINCEPIIDNSSPFDPFVIKIIGNKKTITLTMNSNRINYVELDDKGNTINNNGYKIEDNSFQQFEKLFDSLP